MLPERVDAALLAWLQACPLPVVMVVHVNHANELSPEVVAALNHLRAINVTLLNQAVLLKGVNDNLEALTALSEKLFTAGVLPYYLHQLDRVRGASHFEVSDTKALSLLQQLRAVLSGYLIPQLVREETGGMGKTPVECFNTL